MNVSLSAGTVPVAAPGLPAAAPARSLRDLAAMAFYHRRAILAGFLLPLLLVGGACLLIHPGYDAEARLLVLMGQEGVVEGGASQASPLDQARIVQTEIEILTSAPVMKAALHAVGPLTVYPELQPAAPAGDEAVLDAAARRAARQLRIEAQQNANVVRIRFHHSDAVIAAQVVNTLADTYLAQRKQIFAQARSGFLAEQRDAAEARLRAVEAEIATLRQRAQVVDVAQERGALLQRQQDITAAREAAATRVQVLASEIEGYNEQLARLPAEVTLQRDVTRQPAADRRREALRTLEAEQDAWSRSRPGSVAPPEAERQIAALRAMADRDRELSNVQQRVGRNPQYDQLNLERLRRSVEQQGLPAQIAGLDRQAEEITARLAVLDRAETELARLERQRQIEARNVLDYAQRAEAARVQEDATRLRSSEVRTIQRAQPPMRGSNLLLNLAAGAVIAALFFAVLAGLTASWLRQVFLLPAELERTLERPVLASFWRGGRSRRSAAFGETANAAARAGLAHVLLAPRAGAQGPGRIVHVGGAQSDQEAVAEVIRQAGLCLGRGNAGAVLLLERPGEPSLHREHFRRAGLLREAGPPGGASLPPALMELLPGLRRVEGTALHIAAPPVAQESWAHRIRSHFALTLVDGIGCEGEMRGLDLLAVADAAILVAAAERTRRPVARNLLDRIEQAGCPVFGAVLTGRRAHVPAWLYARI